MTYQIRHCELCTIIDVFKEDGRLDRIVYVHRSEYRHWDA